MYVGMEGKCGPPQLLHLRIRGFVQKLELQIFLNTDGLTNCSPPEFPRFQHGSQNRNTFDRATLSRDSSMENVAERISSTTSTRTLLHLFGTPKLSKFTGFVGLQARQSEIANLRGQSMGWGRFNMINSDQPIWNTGIRKYPTYGHMSHKS
jgi:hypothetical protein